MNTDKKGFRLGRTPLLVFIFFIGISGFTLFLHHVKETSSATSFSMPLDPAKEELFKTIAERVQRFVANGRAEETDFSTDLKMVFPIGTHQDELKKVFMSRFYDRNTNFKFPAPCGGKIYILVERRSYVWPIIRWCADEQGKITWLEGSVGGYL